MTDSPETLPIDLALSSAVVREGRLLVEYEVESRADVAHYVCNLHLDWYGLTKDLDQHVQNNPDATPTASITYVKFVDGSDELLLFSDTSRPSTSMKDLLGGGASAMAPRIPWWSRVEPGKRFKEVIDLPVPVPEWSAHRMPKREEMTKTKAGRLRLRLQYVSEEHAKNVTEHGTFKDIFFLNELRQGHLEAAMKLGEPLDVLRRLDAMAKSGGAHKWS